MGDNVIRLDEEFVSEGVFWNPKMGEDKRFSAKLTFNPEEGIELDAATVPIEFKDLAQSELEEIEFLVGSLADGTPCNLFRVQPHACLQQVSITTSFDSSSYRPGSVCAVLAILL